MKFGVVAGVVQGLFGLIFVPFFLLSMAIAAFAPHQDTSSGMAGFGQVLGVGFGLVMCIMLPVLYAVFGFIFGCLAALVYNLVAKMTGGIEFEVE